MNHVAVTRVVFRADFYRNRRPICVAKYLQAFCPTGIGTGFDFDRDDVSVDSKDKFHLRRTAFPRVQRIVAVGSKLHSDKVLRNVPPIRTPGAFTQPSRNSCRRGSAAATYSRNERGNNVRWVTFPTGYAEVLPDSPRSEPAAQTAYRVSLSEEYLRLVNAGGDSWISSNTIRSVSALIPCSA